MSTSDEATIVDYRQMGVTGLNRSSGYIYEELLTELTGQKGILIFKEMGDNDAVVTSILYVIDKLIRRVPWRVEPASSADFDQDAAKFLESCMHDMETTWIDTIAEVMSMVQYGFSPHEKVFKRRAGSNLDPSMNSKFNDGRIGWRGFPIRSQDTVVRWQFDAGGGIEGLIQQAPPYYGEVFIPIEKLLLFRTTTHKNNPEGRSILRGAYRSWYMKKNIENIEAVGIERDLAGLPMATVPPELMNPFATPENKALLNSIKDLVTNIRRDEQEGVVMPASYDANGNKLFDLKLLSTGGSRSFDTDKVIARYDARIAMCALADFLLLGQNGPGSWAMHSDKTKLFSMSIAAFLTIIAETFNRFAVPELFNLNDFKISDYPKIVHGDLETVDLAELGAFIQQLAAAGMPLFPNEELEKHILKSANLPSSLGDARPTDEQVQPNDRQIPKKVTEIAPAEVKKSRWRLF